MTEEERYKYLSNLMKNKEQWENSIAYVVEFLNDTDKIQAKALWLLGEMGMAHPETIKPYVPQIAGFMKHENCVLRERAIGALGRIGRGKIELVIHYFDEMLKFATDDSEKVRLIVIWASENIATNEAQLYKDKMGIFEKLLHDSDKKVRIEAPEIFRVIGKRMPSLVAPYLDKLVFISENDEERVVRIHAQGAVRITKRALAKENE